MIDFCEGAHEASNVSETMFLSLYEISKFLKNIAESPIQVPHVLFQLFNWSCRKLRYI